MADEIATLLATGRQCEKQPTKSICGMVLFTFELRALSSRLTEISTVPIHSPQRHSLSVKGSEVTSMLDNSIGYIRVCLTSVFVENFNL